MCASLEIRKSLEPILFHIERSQLRWFDHVSKMPCGKTSKHALLAKANREKKTAGRPRSTKEGPRQLTVTN